MVKILYSLQGSGLTFVRELGSACMPVLRPKKKKKEKYRVGEILIMNITNKELVYEILKYNKTKQLVEVVWKVI